MQWILPLNQNWIIGAKYFKHYENSPNLFGGYMMGLAMVLFAEHPGLPPEARLLIATGFLGGLTTFSTFSAETVTLLLRAQYAWVAGIVGLHVAGSLAMTLLGIWTVKAFRG